MDVHVIHWANAMLYPRGGNLVMQTSVKQKHESRLISCNCNYYWACNHFAFQGVFHGIENFLNSGRPINYKLPETFNIYLKTPATVMDKINPKKIRAKIPSKSLHLILTYGPQTHGHCPNSLCRIFYMWYIGYQKTSSFKFFLFPCILNK